jgi:hypothetical protein
VLAAARKLQKLSEAAGSTADSDTAMQRAAAAAGLDWEPANSSSSSSSSSSGSGSAQAIAAARTKLAVLLQLGVVSDATTDITSSTADNSDVDAVNSSASASSSGAAVSRKDMQQRMELLGIVVVTAAAVAGGASEDRVAAETCWLDGARYTFRHIKIVIRELLALLTQTRVLVSCNNATQAYFLSCSLLESSVLCNSER